MEENFNEYKTRFLTNIQINAQINGKLPDKEFLVQTIDSLVSYEEIFDPNIFFFSKRGKNNRIMQFDAYAFDENDKSIILVINDYIDEIDARPLTRTRIDSLCKQMMNFVEEAYEEKLLLYCDDSDEAIKIGREFKRRLDLVYPEGEVDQSIEKFKLFIVTNQTLSERVKEVVQEPLYNRKVEVSIWSIERFFDIESRGLDKEPVIIDLKEFSSHGLPCLKADMINAKDYDAYLSIIPGKLLSDIYYKYGSKLLEGNVRAFLSTRGNVNKGIRQTIISEPTKFFTYNNGIATTANKVELEVFEGVTYITKIEDLQIINGGQTTASLTSASIKKESKLDDIFVPMKLTVIRDEEYDAMISNISKYANSQNKVTDADLFSNHPFHREFEKLAKKYPAPLVNNKTNATYWYYERSRGKYEQEMFKLLTTNSKESFKAKYPKNQVIKKEELAKYLNSIACKPHVVSMGSSKNMIDFAREIDNKYKRNETFLNEYYYKVAIASAIIFKEVDNLVYSAPWYQIGGYKLNIVPYTISKIISCIPQDKVLNFEKIWKNQKLYPSLIFEIEKVAKLTDEFVKNSGGVIVTEYCKKQDTWTKFKQIPYELSKDFLRDLEDKAVHDQKLRDANMDKKIENKVLSEIEIYSLGSDYWEKMRLEGIKAKLMTPKEEDLLKLARDVNKTGRMPSPSQCKLIAEIKKKYEDFGIII